MFSFTEQVATTAFNHDEFIQTFTIENLDDSFIRLCEPRSSSDIQSLLNLRILDILPEISTLNKEVSFSGGSSHAYKSPDKNAAKRAKKDSNVLRYCYCCFHFFSYLVLKDQRCFSATHQEKYCIQLVRGDYFLAHVIANTIAKEVPSNSLRNIWLNS